MRPATQWTPIEGLRQYGLVLIRKLALIAIGWVVVYFLSQWFRHPESIFMLFAPLLGALAGLAIGWHLAEDAVEDSGLNGMPLWVTMMVAGTSTIVGVEVILWLITKWPVEFGGWMLVSSAVLLMMAAAVWRSSADG